MKTVFKLLERELREWRKGYASEKIYFKGCEEYPSAKRSFKLHEKHIRQLEKAIKILKENK